MEEVRVQKENLKKEIQLLESGFERRIQKARHKLGHFTSPSESIRRKPLRSVAIAAGVGFAAGILRRGRSGKKKVTHPGTSGGFSSFLFNELKHVAARKAMFYLSELVDQQIHAMAQKKRSDK